MSYYRKTFKRRYSRIFTAKRTPKLPHFVKVISHKPDRFTGELRFSLAMKDKRANVPNVTAIHEPLRSPLQPTRYQSEQERDYWENNKHSIIGPFLNSKDK